MATVVNVVVLSLSAFFGNMGVAVTGFGMAILYLLVFQVAAVIQYASGADGQSFKHAVFIQSLSLFAVQPLLLWNAQVSKHVNWPLLLLMIPATLVATPLGSITGEQVALALWPSPGTHTDLYVHRTVPGRHGRRAGSWRRARDAHRALRAVPQLDAHPRAGARMLLPFPLALRTQIPCPVRSFSPLPARSCLHDGLVF